MRYDEPPSEDTIRELIDEASGRGEETVTVEATREAGDAWVRAGFSEQARVLDPHDPRAQDAHGEPPVSRASTTAPPR